MSAPHTERPRISSSTPSIILNKKTHPPMLDTMSYNDFGARDEDKNLPELFSFRPPA